MITIQSGTIDDFFKSALHTAKEIDENKKVTPKHIIWMETEDLLNILKIKQKFIIVLYLMN